MLRHIAEVFASSCATDGLLVLGVQIRAKNLQPALQWATDHRQKLSPDGSPSAFEFKLQALAFVNLLRSEGALGTWDECLARFCWQQLR